MQSPLPPTLMLLYNAPPFLMRSVRDMLGYAALRASTARLHPAGMDVLTKAFVLAEPNAAATGALTLVPFPKNLASGHVIIMSMHPTSTKRETADARLDRGRASGGAHRSQARKSWRAS